RRSAASRRPGARGGGPRSLGRTLVGLVLLALTLVVLYAMWFMPEADSGGGQQRGSLGESSERGGDSGGDPDGPQGRGGDKDEDTGDGDSGGADTDSGKQPSEGPGSGQLPEGFAMHEDAAGFRIALPEGWDRRTVPSSEQVRFDRGNFEMIVVNGRDSTAKYGKDPLAYQSDKERELEPYRSSGWSSASSLRRIDVGDTAMAEGTYTWEDESGRKVYVRNRAMIVDDRYHLVLVIGPEDEEKAVDRYFEGAVDTYQPLS
ncbi:hypothetical protein AN216_10780, partial [Streptomyces oceani]